MAERVAACADDAEFWAAAGELAGEPAEDAAATEFAVAAELTAAELAGRSAGFDEVLQAASAEKAVIAMMILVRRALRIRRAIPHAATPALAVRARTCLAGLTRAPARPGSVTAPA